MTILFWILGILAFLIAFFVLGPHLIPKGYLLQEISFLPTHVINLMQAPTDGMKVHKVKYGPHRRQHILVCLPENGQPTQKDIIYYVHGGGWRTGSPKVFRPGARQMVAKGYAVIMPAYRMDFWLDYRAMREDITNGLKKTLEILPDYGLEGKKLIAGGDSAGGNLSAHLLLNREELKKIDSSQEIFAAYFSLSGALDMDQLASTPARWSYSGIKGKPMFEAANPMTYMDGVRSLPVFCIHGTRDGMAHLNCTRSFVEAYPHKDQLTYVELEGETHLYVCGTWLYKETKMTQAFFGWLDQLSP